jgi:hypothetical protein
MYLLVIFVDVSSGCVCYAIHVLDYERHRSCRRYTCDVHVLVKELEHDIDGILERGGGVYEAEKGTGPAGREIADFESQKGFALGYHF